MTDFKKSLDNIEPTQEIKDEIFNNIMKMAEEKPVLKVLPKKNKYMNIAKVAVFAVVFAGICVAASGMMDFDVQQQRSDVGLMNVNDVSETSIDVYYENKESIEVQTVENMSSDLIQVWDEICNLGLGVDGLVLEAFAYSENVLILDFNYSLGDFSLIENSDLKIEAIEKTFSAMYADLEDVIVNIE